MRTRHLMQKAGRLMIVAGCCWMAAVVWLPAPSHAADTSETRSWASVPRLDLPPTPLDPAELGFDEMVFVKRKPYSSDHYYTDINNGTSPDRFLPDNGIYIYNVRTQSERAVVTARRSARRTWVHWQDQSVVRCPTHPVRFSPGPRLRFSHLGSQDRRHRIAADHVSRRRTKRRRWRGGAARGTPTTSILVTCPTARLSSRQRDANTRCSAAARPILWHRVFIA